MGPRFLNRGKVEWHIIDDGLNLLQWGRGFSTAERAAAEMIETAPSAGFNGAAVSQPRKAGRTPHVPANPTSFNGAAVSQPRKAAATARGGAGGFERFNGAAVSQPRKGRTR